MRVSPRAPASRPGESGQRTRKSGRGVPADRRTGIGAIEFFRAFEIDCVQLLNAGESPLTDEVRYRLLRYLDEHPNSSQRELARELDVSLGKVNYCLRALIKKGWLKMRNFRRSRHKLTYAYMLTPKGIEAKVTITASFLRRKIAEYETLFAEIERLRREVAENNPADEQPEAPTL